MWKDNNPCTTIVIKPKIINSIHSSRESLRFPNTRTGHVLLFLKVTGIGWYERRLISNLYMDQRGRLKLEQGRTRNEDLERSQARMLFVTDCIQVVPNALPRKLLKALETSKWQEIWFMAVHIHTKTWYSKCSEHKAMPDHKFLILILTSEMWFRHYSPSISLFTNAKWNHSCTVRNCRGNSTLCLRQHILTILWCWACGCSAIMPRLNVRVWNTCTSSWSLTKK